MWKGLAVQCCMGCVGSASSSGRMEGPPVLWGRVQEAKELGLYPKDRESQGRVLSKRAVWGIPLGWSVENGIRRSLVGAPGGCRGDRSERSRLGVRW